MGLLYYTAEMKVLVLNLDLGDKLTTKREIIKVNRLKSQSDFVQAKNVKQSYNTNDT